jgi:hypothetical protein
MEFQINFEKLVENMAKCNCNRSQEVLFVCLKTEKQCADAQNQKYYCIKCYKEKHDHKSSLIEDEFKEIYHGW